MILKMNKPLFQQTDLGWQMKDERHLVFFGSAHSQDTLGLEKEFADFRFQYLQQIHSSDCVWIDQLLPAPPKADAHLTRLSAVALAIRTADCLPIMICAEGLVAAVHAGWRGLAGGILRKTIQQMQTKGAEPKKLTVFIGPHIGVQSFEVGVDVSEQICAVVSGLSAACSQIIARPHADAQKRYVDLLEVSKISLADLGVSREKIIAVPEDEQLRDTFLNPQLHSFRRDKTSARQISFVALR